MYPWHKEKEIGSFAIVSGGFDPIHEGHIDNIVDAYYKVGPIIVIANSDAWLTRKKGKPFQTMKTRYSILSNLKQVSFVYCNEEEDDLDGTVCKSLKKIRALYPEASLTFCKGGDRVPGNVPEIDVCNLFGINIMYNVGGEKVNSSSVLLENWKR